MADYASESDVYRQSGFTSEMIQRVIDSDGTEVSNLINHFLDGAEKRVKELIDIPHLVPRELHCGTGEDDEFQLGPEDEEVYFDEEVENLVDSVKHCFFQRLRKKRPYPKDCDEFTDDATKWDDGGGDYTAPTNENTIKKANKYSMKFDWSGAAGKARYPDVEGDVYLNKNIDIFDYVFFRVRSDTANTTVTIRLYDEDGNSNSATYLAVKASKWYNVMLHLVNDFTSTVNWEDEPLNYFEIEVDKACTLYLDNLNFNDEWCYTAPQGLLVIMHRSTEQPPADGYCFYTTYTYDPFKEEVPENIRDAVAQMAAIRIIDHMLGVRQGAIAFEYMGDTMLSDSDKETLYARKTQLTREMNDNLAAYGYGFRGSVAMG